MFPVDKSKLTLFEVLYEVVDKGLKICCLEINHKNKEPDETRNDLLKEPRDLEVTLTKGGPILDSLILCISTLSGNLSSSIQPSDLLNVPRTTYNVVVKH